MSLPTNASQHQPPTVKVDFTQVVPAELSKLIADYVASTKGRSYAGEAGIEAFSRTCKNSRAAAISILFETVMIRLWPTDEIPRKHEPWRPRQWQTPDLLALLLRSSALRSHARNVRISVQPFPICEWTDEQFAATKRLLEDSHEEMAGTREQLTALLHHSASHLELSNQDERQRYVMDAYRAMFLLQCERSDGSHHLEWTEDAGHLLQPLLLQMPKLRHLESAAPGRKHALCHCGTMYTDRLILRLAPRKVDSVSLLSWPDGLASVDGYSVINYSEVGVMDENSPDPRLASFVARAPRLTTLSLHHSCVWLSLRGGLPMLVQLRADALHQLANLTRLGLSQTQSALEIEEVMHARQGVPPKLQMMLVDVVIPHVKELKLTNWAVTRDFYKQGARPSCLQRSFPALSRLAMQSVAPRAANQEDAEEVWREIVSDVILREGEIVVVVEQPKALVPVDTGFGITELEEGTKYALQQLTRPSIRE